MRSNVTLATLALSLFVAACSSTSQGRGSDDTAPDGESSAAEETMPRTKTADGYVFELPPPHAGIARACVAESAICLPEMSAKAIADDCFLAARTLDDRMVDVFDDIVRRDCDDDLTSLPGDLGTMLARSPCKVVDETDAVLLDVFVYRAPVRQAALDCLELSSCGEAKACVAAWQQAVDGK